MAFQRTLQLCLAVINYRFYSGISVAVLLVLRICRSLESRQGESVVNTVAFLPTAGIFRDSEGLYLIENKWSGREDLNLRPPGPEPETMAC